ncbi:FAD-dependent oxidoreductase [Hominifimenecus sp. rT4P-3]|uniref:FAD-dependent oxidoreductase n=1 Tax=Hominifimenecus sp. rT4P-3 TaxID=3242979 RepID=UPI003DA3D8C5
MSMWEDCPVYGSYDVVVAGGGTAGFAAGVSAARNGLKTLIIEEQAFLGGTSTGGGVGVFFGFAKGETNENLCGIVKDMMDRMMEKKGTRGIQTIYCLGLKDMDVPAAEYNDDVLKVVMDELVEESGAQVLFHTRFIGLEKEEDEIRSVIIHSSRGIQKVYAKVFIDASFHAFLAAEAGVPWEVGDENGVIQPGTLMYKTAGVDFSQYAKFPVEERQKLARKGLESGDLPVNFLLARQLQNGAVYHNQSRVPVNPLEPENWSEAERAARAQVVKISNWWVKNVPGFEHAYLSSTSSSMGLRDSRRVKGSFILTGDALMEGKEYEDAIAASSYPMDIHHHDGRKDNTLIRPKSGVYWIPYRCLTTREVANLLVVGRCISADAAAHASSRVTITCMRTGEAAGYAAAESLKSGVAVRDVDGRLIRSKMML